MDNLSMYYDLLADERVDVGLYERWETITAED